MATVPKKPINPAINQKSGAKIIAARQPTYKIAILNDFIQKPSFFLSYNLL